MLWGSSRRPSAFSPLNIGDGDNNNKDSKGFTRAGSFSQRVKKTTERFSHLIKRDWGSSENVEVQRRSIVLGSPQFERKGSVSVKEKDVMPPPKAAPPKKKKSRKEKSKENEPSDDEMKSVDSSPSSDVVMPAKSLYI